MNRGDVHGKGWRRYAGGAALAGAVISCADGKGAEVLERASARLVCTGETCSPALGLAVTQSRAGSGGLEIIVPHLGGGLARYTRSNHAVWPFVWQGPETFGEGDFLAAAAIRSNYGSLEVIALRGDALVHYWREDAPDGAWHGPIPVTAGVRGQPGFVQSSLGGQGNFELVVPRAAGGLAHWYRNNDVPTRPWQLVSTFGSGTYDAVSLVQNDAGNLELVARRGETLETFVRSGGTTGPWTGPTTLLDGAAGAPSIVQNRRGMPGELEVVTPLASGGLGAVTGARGAQGTSWSATKVVAVGDVTSAALLQTSAGGSDAGELVAVARIDGELHIGTRGAAPSSSWQRFVAFGAEPTAPRERLGAWEPPFVTGVVGIHALLLRTGRVLLFGYEDENSERGASLVFDPAAGTTTTPRFSGSVHPEVFCSGHAFAADGRAIIVGGHMAGTADLHAFDPASEIWTKLGTLASEGGGRWYPSVVTLPSGELFAITGTFWSGSANPVNNTWQIIDPASGTVGPQVPVDVTPFSTDGHAPVDLYPFLFVLPSGKVMVHARQTTRFFDPATRTWDRSASTTQYAFSRTYPKQGSAVLLPLSPEDGYRARVLLVGGSGAEPVTTDTAATATVELLDLGASEPRWTYASSLHRGRLLPNAILLPDGTVLVTGGSGTGTADTATTAVLAAELYRPTEGTWTMLAPMRVPRLYHATALLLPDARVLVTGKDGIFNQPPYKYPEHRLEIFDPPYLFAGPRPELASAPSSVSYGSRFDVRVSDAAMALRHAVLVRPGAVTHSLDMNQRLVVLETAGREGSALSLVAPPNANVAPPGDYMLFLISSAGIPSHARFVHLGP